MQVGKSVMRVAKNSLKGYSETQTKVRDATSNDPWGPSGTQMSEISALTYNQNDFVEIMEMLDKRLNDKGKNWRHVFKSLVLLDYLLHAGSENCVMYFRENHYVVKTLKEFVHIDDQGKDQGINVRQKAKDISALLTDEERLRSQRKTRANMRDRMEGNVRPAEYEPPRNPPPGRSEDSELQRAIEASKRSAEEEQSRNAPRSAPRDDDLEEALRLSREEDERRRRNGDDSVALFDDGLQRPAPDNDNDNLIDVNAQWQQPMVTGVQYTGYNPSMAQQQAQQEEWARQQQMMELQRQQAEQQQYQMMMQQQAEQQQQYLQQQQYMQQQQYQQHLMAQQQQPMMPQQTAYGSNNPFAAFTQQTAQAQSPMPTAAETPAQPQAQTQPQAAPAQSPSPAPAMNGSGSQMGMQATGAPRMRVDDAKHANLAQALASGDGQDTFGNTGNLRYGAGGRGGGNPFLVGQRTGMPSEQARMGQQSQGQPQPQQQQDSNQPFFTI